MRAWMLCVALVACAGEPKPGEVGYEDCDAYDPGAGVLACEQVEICCEQVSEVDVQCAYVTADGTRYECLSEVDCFGAAEDMICDVCPEASTGGPYDVCG